MEGVIKMVEYLILRIYEFEFFIVEGLIKFFV